MATPGLSRRLCHHKVIHMLWRSTEMMQLPYLMARRTHLAVLRATVKWVCVVNPVVWANIRIINEAWAATMSTRALYVDQATSRIKQVNRHVSLVAQELTTLGLKLHFAYLVVLDPTKTNMEKRHVNPAPVNCPWVQPIVHRLVRLQAIPLILLILRQAFQTAVGQISLQTTLYTIL